MKKYTATQLGIIEAVSSLKPLYRDIIVMYDVHRLSVSEIAQRLCLNEDEAKCRLCTARANLQKNLLKLL